MEKTWLSVVTLFLTQTSLHQGFALGLVRDNVCYGHSYKLPSKRFSTQSNELVYFTPSHGGPKKLIIDKGTPVDPRIRIASDSFWIMSLTNRDEGTFGVSSDGNRLKNVLMLQILDCAETITMVYGESLERHVPADKLVLDYSPLDSLDEPIALWNRTDPLSGDKRRGSVTNNMWKISNLTQADSGFYNFRGLSNIVRSRILLKVEDSQGNLALAEKLKESKESNHAIIAYVCVIASVVAFLIFCCCCCQKRCKNDSSTPETEAAAPTDPPPTTVPTYSGPVYPAVYPQEPGYQPVNIHPPPPVINMNPSQPGNMDANLVPPAINVSTAPPSYMNVYPFPPDINVSPALPGVMNVNPLPPGITVNPLHTEVAPPADRGPTSTPTFSSEFLSSDFEPRFELTGFNVPFAPPLSSNTPSSDVYNSAKINF